MTDSENTYEAPQTNVCHSCGNPRHRIAELEAENKQLQTVLDSLSEMSDREDDEVDEIDRLEAEVAGLREKLQVAKGGFCRKCGASFPHRAGEGRCPDCQWAE